MNETNHRILLKSRPEGPVTPENFELDEQPVSDPADGEIKGDKLAATATLFYTELEDRRNVDFINDPNNPGNIIEEVSLQSTRAFPNGLAYGASKSGITQLTRAMSEAWSADGININAMAPGFFPTELTAPVFDDVNTASKLAARPNATSRCT